MLHAIHQNKARRGLHEPLDWRVLFKGCEDTLTSAVFSNLFHLPESLFWHVLAQASFGLQLPIPAESISMEGYEFWPRWGAAGTSNTRDVEPDIFIRASSFDLIVEAKRYDSQQQYEGQWKNELGGYVNEYGTSKMVLLLAVGGLGDGDEQPVDIEIAGGHATVYKCQWRNLLETVRHMRNQSVSWPVRNVLDDIVKGFSLHGYTVTDWFATLSRDELDKLRPGDGLALLQRS